MYKLSKYNIIKALTNNEYFLFNTFHNSFMIIDENKKNSLLNLDEDYIFEFKKNNFIVEEEYNEIDECNNIRLNEIKNDKYGHYTIFTTLNCNANCSYCFEYNYSKDAMNINTAKEIYEFIIKESKNKDRIHIQWFGGEPLLNTRVIEIISDKVIDLCNKKNIIYTSNIVTNGSLINNKVISILNKYKINNIQITLDGTKEEYEKRKKYNNKRYSFDLIINNIEKCLINSLNVSIRINFDKNNFNDILKLLDYLSMYSKYKNFYCYCIPIYDDKINKELVYIKETKGYYNKIFNKMIDNELIKTEKYFNLKRQSSFCRATNEHSQVFDVLGERYKCTHLFFDKKVNNNICLECNSCIFLPMCQGGCPIKDIEKDKCYIYKYCFDEVINALLRIKKIDAKVKEDYEY